MSHNIESYLIVSDIIPTYNVYLPCVFKPCNTSCWVLGIKTKINTTPNEPNKSSKHAVPMVRQNTHASIESRDSYWLRLDSRTSYLFYLIALFSKTSFFIDWLIYIIIIYCFHILVLRLKMFRFSKKVMVIYWRDSLLLISCKVCTFVCFYFIKSFLDKFQNWLNFLWNSEITKTLYQYIIW